jgi:tellurite resistance protein TehA-like permease
MTLLEVKHLDSAPLMAGQIFHVAVMIMWGASMGLLIFVLSPNPHMIFPFNLGWCTCPLGVSAVATTTLAKDLLLHFFKIFGMIHSIVGNLFLIIVAFGTIWKASSGTDIFFLHDGMRGRKKHGGIRL